MTARILKRRGGGGYYNADGVTLKVKDLHHCIFGNTVGSTEKTQNFDISVYVRLPQVVVS